mgnify:FL=1
MDALAFLAITALALIVIFGAIRIYNRARDSIILNDPHEHLPEDYDK